MLSSRQRVLCALNHQVPDRPPLDLGGTIMSGIMARALRDLRQALGLAGPVKVNEVFQMLGEVELDLVERLDIDVLPITTVRGFFDIARADYKPGKLMDGTDVLVPGRFNVETVEDGSWQLRQGGLSDAPVVATMPAGGHYFDQLREARTRWDFVPPNLDELARTCFVLRDDELEHLRQRAASLRTYTDKALVLEVDGALGLTHVGSVSEFLMLLGCEPNYVRELFDFLTERAFRHVDLLWEAVGDNADIVVIDGFDFGSQKAELFSPDLFRELFAPAYRRQIDHIQQRTSWFTWKHSCGSITGILPDLVACGLDIINPVQCSAVGMEAQELKSKYGDRLTFWGGGVDTQKTLPFGTPEQVREEVRQRLEVLGAGGGFVFCPVHNIQANTPVENIIAAYETARQYTYEDSNVNEVQA